MRDDRERLLDMLEAIRKIEQYAHEETYSSHDDNLVEVWMIHPFADYRRSRFASFK